MAGGRPTKFNSQICSAIVDAVSKYTPYKRAAEGNGINPDTLYEWLKIAKADRAAGLDTEYVKFSDALKHVEMNKIQQLCASIESGADRWQSCAWLLERRWREDFGADAGVIQELMEAFKDLQAKFDAQEKK